MYRTIFYIPAIATGVGTAYLWAQIFSAHGGLINTVLRYLWHPGTELAI